MNHEIKMVYREGGQGAWRTINQVPEDSDGDVEAGYISSDESALAADLGERIRAKPSKDIWELVINTVLNENSMLRDFEILEFGLMGLINIDRFLRHSIENDDIVYSLRHLPQAEELVPLIESGMYDAAIEYIQKHEKDISMKTAILWASWLGRNVFLGKLINLGADVNTADDNGRSCLHLSCLVGQVDCVKLLLQKGADPNKWDCIGEINATPLHCAASAGSLVCVQLLIAHGADINAGLSQQRSPLYYAVLSDAPEVVRELLQARASPDTPQVFTETPLHVAASLGSYSCTRLLLDFGADVRAALGPAKTTALHLAAEDGHAECAGLLLERGANIDSPNSRGQTPLHLAALSQTVEVAELLVANNANINSKDLNGRTPLHASIVRGARACDVTRLLLAAGADPNEPDSFGYTPLHIAALNEFSACVLLLLDYGGDVTLRTNGGVSALSFIVRRVPNVIPHYMNKFDDCVHLSEHELGDVDCELTIDFRPLVPCLSRGEAELLLSFIEVGRKDILKHPVAETFLFLKWRRIRKFFVMSFIYHAVFITLYSLYILTIFLCEERTCEVPGYLYPVEYVILILNVLFMTKELFQACLDWTAYIHQWENWVQWLIIVGVFLCAIPTINKQTVDKNSNTSNWQHDVAAATIFLCWLELMLIIGRFPTFGLYVQMFTTVTVNFSRFLIAYSCLLIAFGLAFSVLFSNYPAFKLPASLVKTVMMMSGELEYEDIFYNNNNNDTQHIQYPVTAHSMFLVFVVLVTVILTNLLVGLAVSDIQALQESAGLDRLVTQTQLVAHLESMLFSSLLTCAPKQLIGVLRWGALLTASNLRTINIRPNDPRENRLPKDLIASIYKMVASKKETKRSVRKNNNYECKIKKCKPETKDKPPEVKRKSNLFDRYSFESQIVERKRRITTSSEAKNRISATSVMQDMCMMDMKNQLTELTTKVNRLLEYVESKKNQGDTDERFEL